MRKIKQLRLKLFFIAMMVLAMFANSFAQNAKVDAKGNYVYVKPPIDTTGTPTGKTFTDSKGNVYPVLLSKTGSLFVVRTSAKGSRYKFYLRTEAKI